jgi:hypothetical protein
MGQITDGTNTINWLRVSGRPNNLAERVQDITRPGIDGQAYRRINKRARPFQVELVATLTSESALQSTVDTMFGFQGKLVTLTDDHGRSYFNVMVLDVRERQRQHVTVPSNGRDWILRMQARMQVT